MKTNILRLCFVGSLLLFFQINMQAQNIHETVTHGSDEAAKVPVSNNSHKEGAMPQGDKDFGIYAGRVTIFKDYFSRALPKAAASGLDDGIGLSSYDWKQWTEQDLARLATSYNGVDMFSSLMYMKNSAAIKDANGNYTPEAIYSQNALTELKPDRCKNWKSFYNMIVRVEDTYKDTIIPLMKRKNIDIPEGYGTIIDFGKSSDIAVNPMENPAFDQQAALTQLEKAGVTKDANSLRTVSTCAPAVGNAAYANAASSKDSAFGASCVTTPERASDWLASPSRFRDAFTLASKSSPVLTLRCLCFGYIGGLLGQGSIAPVCLVIHRVY